MKGFRSVFRSKILLSVVAAIVALTVATALVHRGGRGIHEGNALANNGDQGYSVPTWVGGPAYIGPGDWNQSSKPLVITSATPRFGTRTPVRWRSFQINYCDTAGQSISDAPDSLAFAPMNPNHRWSPTPLYDPPIGHGYNPGPDRGGASCLFKNHNGTPLYIMFEVIPLKKETIYINGFDYRYTSGGTRFFEFVNLEYQLQVASHCNIGRIGCNKTATTEFSNPHGTTLAWHNYP